MKEYNKHTIAGIRLPKFPLWGIQGAGQAKEKRGEVRTDAEKHGCFLNCVYLLKLHHLYANSYHVKFKWIKR